MYYSAFMHLLCIRIQECLQIAQRCQKLENETYDSPVTRLQESEFKAPKPDKIILGFVMLQK